MFVGSVPRDVVNQLIQVADIRENDHVFVCCSGSFRVDLAIKEHQNTKEFLGQALVRLNLITEEKLLKVLA